MSSSPAEEYLEDHPENYSLAPLPPDYHRGLIAISIFALISFTLTSTLFLYLTFKLLGWHFRKRSRAKIITRNIPEPGPVFTFEIGAYGPDGATCKVAHDRSLKRIQEAKKRPPNQFLILIFNLIIADMHQGAAFVLSITWLREGGIFLGTPTCFVQGFFDSNGNLSSSLFITAIAIHTYLSVVRGYRPPHRVLCAVVVGIWLFVYLLSIIPLLVTHNGEEVGGYFTRADPWCWINDAYENLQLLTHYIFIFLSLAATCTLYITIFLHLRRKATEKGETTGPGQPSINLKHNPAFLIYPVIYVMCTLPLALGRIADMTGAPVPAAYYCFAGCLIASNGSFDCILFATTRYSILFGPTDDIDVEDTGLETFAFMRTPAGNTGHEVWIAGGEACPRNSTLVGGWWQRFGGGSGPGAKASWSQFTTPSQESLRSKPHEELAIQMDVVTTLTIEVDESMQQNQRFPDPLRSETPSVNSGEKHVMRGI
ncbi:hypothetical protein AK830_g11074 [Neonectria ditissima]|uniref:G-protein coupled receptors family 1 profile domain-containing protein n=1 Tax=Neonectria ditissima TaxID=78410 RepID=A0A0P7ARY3_9HYPO|nr:hypothetical protein AK830_g11074 [Neonectria ditissima]